MRVEIAFWLGFDEMRPDSVTLKAGLNEISVLESDSAEDGVGRTEEELP